MQGEIRQQLLSDDDKLYSQDEQLQRIKATGINAMNTMTVTNQDLRQQRDVIGSINDKNSAINTQMEATNKKVLEMTRKEFMFKLYIFIAIFLLFCADIGVLIGKFM